MPRYDVELSDGRVVTLESDHEPSESEILSSLEPASAAPSSPFTQDPFDVGSAFMQTPDTGFVRNQQSVEGAALPPPDLTPGADRQALGRFGQAFFGGLAAIPEAAAVLAEKPAAFMESIFPLEGGVPRTAEENLLFRGGQQLRDEAAGVFPVDPTRPRTFLTDTLPSGAGSMASFLTGGAALKGSRLLATPGQVAGGVAALGAASSGADAYREAVEAGADDDTAFKVFLANAGLGTTEAIPIAGWLNRLNKASGGAFKQAIIEGSEEAAQEIFQTIGSNLVASKTFDPARKIFEGAGEGGAAGATLGGLMSLVVSAIGGRRARGGMPQPSAPTQPQPAVAPTESAAGAIDEAAINQQLERTPDALQPEAAPVLRDVQQPEFAQESQEQVPAEVSGGEAAETRVTPEIKSFTDTLLNPSVRITNTEANPIGLQVKSIADLDALLETLQNIQTKQQETLKQMSKGPLSSEQEADLVVSQRTQYPREIIEIATNSGAWQEEAPTATSLGTEMGERPLDFRKNPEVRNWLIKNADKLWKGGPLESNLAELNKGGEKLPKDYTAEEWDLVAENLRDNADTFAAGGATRHGGVRPYELYDLIDDFLKFARDNGSASISESFKKFRSQSDASRGQLSQLRQVLTDMGLIVKKPQKKKGGETLEEKEIQKEKPVLTEPETVKTEADIDIKLPDSEFTFSDKSPPARGLAQMSPAEAIDYVNQTQGPDTSPMDALRWHWRIIMQAFRDKVPINAKAAESYEPDIEGSTQRLSEWLKDRGYVKDGNDYIYKPTPKQKPGAIGYFPRQSESQGLGEPALPPTVEDVRRQRETEKRESGIAFGEKTTPSRGQWFAGLNPRETSGMMQARANTFLQGKTDEQAIVDLVRVAGGDPGVQLDNQAANFAIKDLLVRIHAKIQSSKNPVYHANAWQQIDRLAELSRRMGAEDARSLVSRQLAYKQIDWMMPLLTWRGIVQDKWRKALKIPPTEPVAGKDTPEASKKLKLPRLEGPEAEELGKLSQRAKNEPQGVKRNKTLEEMVRILQAQAPISKMDLLRDVWYGSVLMRVGTMLNVLAGSYSTGASFAALAALDRVARLHPVQAMKIIGQFIGGTLEGTLIADQIARKGAYHLLPDAEQRMVNLLSGKSGARFDNLESLLRNKNPLGVLAYTRRFMAALDYIGALGTRDSQVLYGALTRGDQDSLDAMNKRFDKATNQRAEEQAKSEMGPKASRAEVLTRKREILEEGVSDEIKEAAVQTARRAAQNADPRGIPGILYQMSAKLPFWVRAPTGLAFMRSAMNMVQNAVDYMPGIGAVSAIRGKMATLPESHPMHRFGLDIPIEERRMMWAAQGTSLGIATAAAALFLGDKDDDDEGWEISGGWRGLTPQRRSQLMNLGERPNSIRFGKKGPWISFKQMPFAPPLAIVGAMRDEERFHATDWNGENAANKIVAAWLSGLLYVRDISSLSGVAGMFDANAWSTQESPTKLDEKVNKFASQTVGRAAAGYIPSVIKEIDEFADPTLYRPGKDELAAWWLRNVPYARRTSGEGPVLNNFGEPVQLTPPPIKSWAGFGKDNDLYNTLGQLASRGVFLPEPGRTAKIVDNDSVYRDMTENEWYQFIKTRGPIFKEDFTPEQLEWLRTVEPDEAIKWLRETSEKASERARTELWPLSKYPWKRK